MMTRQEMEDLAFGPLRTDSARARPEFIIGRAVVEGPPASILPALQKIVDAHPNIPAQTEGVWNVFLLDAAIQSELLVTLADGTPAKDEKILHMAVQNMIQAIDIGEVAQIMEAAYRALLTGARRTLS